MRFVPTSIPDVWIIELEERHDDRGFFARSFCQREFAEHGIDFDVRQTNLSFNSSAGTLRGLHFQFPPSAESKVVRCTSGALHDVVVDLRAESATFGRHVAVELSAKNRIALVIPPRFAHGFVTLEDNTEVMYLMSEFYAPAQEGGLPWNDPTLAIEWPRPPVVIAPRDATGFTPFDDQADSLRTRMVPHGPT